VWLWHLLVGLVEWIRAPRLPQPFVAEVLLDGHVVATVSDPGYVDMFWYSYRIEPVCGSSAIDDDDLWRRCRFTFREPTTGLVCARGFAGPPCVRDGRVTLRSGMYFERPARLPRARARR
jgi:hypothetical protein